MDMEFRSYMQAKINVRPLRTSVHSNTRQLALGVWTQLGKIQKLQCGRVILKIILKKYLLES